MAITLLYNEAYATNAEADIFLASNAVWLALDSAVKDDALLWARYYLDENFDCSLSSLDSIPDELKLANSLLAVDFNSEGSLHKDKITPSVKKKKVDADGVSTEKEFLGGDSNSYLPPSIMKVRGLLSTICSRINTTGTVNLVRA